MVAVLRAHMQRSGPLARGCGSVEQSGGRGGGRGSGLPTHFLCMLRIKPSAQHCVVDTVEGSQGVHTELSPVTIVSAKQALVLV